MARKRIGTIVVSPGVFVGVQEDKHIDLDRTYALPAGVPASTAGLISVFLPSPILQYRFGQRKQDLSLIGYRRKPTKKCVSSNFMWILIW